MDSASHPSLNSTKCLEWATQRGAIVRAIKLGFEDDSGTILYVDRTDGNADQPYLFIPSALLVNLPNICDFADAQPEFKQVYQEWASSRIDVTFKLAAVLILLWHSRGHESPWTPYFTAILSAPGLENTPAFWSEEERQLLVGTSIEGLAETQIGLLAATLQYFQSRPEASSFTTNITLDEFVWLHILIDSRTLSGASGSSLVPMLDFTNHSSLREDDIERLVMDLEWHAIDPVPKAPQCAVWNSSDDGFTLTGHADLLDGHELLFSYGVRGNGELLLTYGFTEAYQRGFGSRHMTLEVHHTSEGEEEMCEEGVAQAGTETESDTKPCFLLQHGLVALQRDLSIEQHFSLDANDESGTMWMLFLPPTKELEGIGLDTALLNADQIHTTLHHFSTSAPAAAWTHVQRRTYGRLRAHLAARLARLVSTESTDTALQDVAARTAAWRLHLVNDVRDAETRLVQDKLHNLDRLIGLLTEPSSKTSSSETSSETTETHVQRDTSVSNSVV